MNHSLLKDLLRNAGHLLSSNIAASLIGLLTNVLVATSLGAAEYGRLAVIVVGSAVIGRIVTFQSWQAIIYFGASLIQIGKIEELRVLSAALLWLELAAAAVGAMAGAFVLHYFGGLAKWDPHVTLLAQVYLITLVGTVTGWASGLLRLLDRFKAIARYTLMSSLLKLCLTVLVLWLSPSLESIVASWILSSILQQLLFAYGVARVESIQCLLPPGRMSLSTLKAYVPRFKGFLLRSNLDGLLRVVRELDILILSYVISLNTLGAYRLARQLGGALGKLSDPFFQSLYPMLSALRSKGDSEHSKALVGRSSTLVGGAMLSLGLVFLIFGETVLELTLPSEYIELGLFHLFGIILAAQVMWGFAQPYPAALMASGRIGFLVRVHLLLVLAYLIILITLSQHYGAYGAAASFFLFQFSWFVAMWLGYRVLNRTLSE